MFPDRYFGELIFLVQEGGVDCSKPHGGRGRFAGCTAIIRRISIVTPRFAPTRKPFLTKITSIPDIYRLMTRERTCKKRNEFSQCAARGAQTWRGAEGPLVFGVFTALPELEKISQSGADERPVGQHHYALV